MKTLYESILGSTNTGKSDFSFDNVTGYPTFNNFSDFFNMMKVKKALKDEFMVPYNIKKACDGKLIAILLTQYTYSKTEIDLLRKQGWEIDEVFKSRIGEFLHKKNADRFKFATYKGVDGWQVVLTDDEDPMAIRFIFTYDLNR